MRSVGFVHEEGGHLNEDLYRQGLKGANVHFYPTAAAVLRDIETVRSLNVLVVGVYIPWTWPKECPDEFDLPPREFEPPWIYALIHRLREFNVQTRIVVYSVSIGEHRSQLEVLGCQLIGADVVAPDNLSSALFT